MSYLRKLDMNTRISAVDDDIKDFPSTRRSFKDLCIELANKFYDLKSKVNLLIDGELGLIQLEPRAVEPLTTQKRRGTIVYADGLGWNPGSGEGVYRWDGSAWKFLG